MTDFGTKLFCGDFGDVPEDTLQTFLSSPKILDVVKKEICGPFKDLEHDKFLLNHSFICRYNQGMSSTAMNLYHKRFFEVVKKRSKGKIHLDREFHVVVSTKFGDLRLLKIDHSNDTQRNIRKDLTGAEYCLRWLPRTLLTGPSGQPLFRHKSTHAVNFMDCVQRMASGVAQAAQTRKS